jgi:hypothetical protein
MKLLSAAAVARTAPADEDRATSGDPTDGHNGCVGKRPSIRSDTGGELTGRPSFFVIDYRLTGG